MNEVDADCHKWFEKNLSFSASLRSDNRLEQHIWTQIVVISTFSPLSYL